MTDQDKKFFESQFDENLKELDYIRKVIDKPEILIVIEFTDPEGNSQDYVPDLSVDDELLDFIRLKIEQRKKNLLNHGYTI